MDVQKNTFSLDVVVRSLSVCVLLPLELLAFPTALQLVEEVA